MCFHQMMDSSGPTLKLRQCERFGVRAVWAWRIALPGLGFASACRRSEILLSLAPAELT